jgi:hypothetical protein
MTMILNDLAELGLHPWLDDFEDYPHYFVPSRIGLTRQQYRRLRESGFRKGYYYTNEGFLPGWALKITKED